MELAEIVINSQEPIESNVSNSVASKAMKKSRLGEAFSNKDLEKFAQYISMGDDPSEMYDDFRCIYHAVLMTRGCAEYAKKCMECPVVYKKKLAKWSVLYAAKSFDPTMLRHNAIPNYADVNNDTPLSCAMKNVLLDNKSKRMVLEKLLEKDPVKNSALRYELLNKFEDLQFPAADMEMSYELPPSKSCCIRDDGCEDKTNEKLFLAIKNHHKKCFDSLLAQGAKYIGKGYSNMQPLEYALICINSYALRILLAKDEVQFEPYYDVFTNLVHCFDRSPHIKVTDFGKCLDVLLKYKCLDINEVDSEGRTIVQLSSHFSDECVLEILKRGCLLAIKSDEGELAVSNIRPNVLNAFFDSLIIRENDTDSWKITMDYSNFQYGPKLDDNEYMYMNNFATQMEIVKAIAETETSKQLLEHPLITIFLELKWKQLSGLFYLNFWLYMYFVCACVPYILFKLGNYEKWTQIFCGLTALGVSYLVARECLQLKTNFRKYLREPVNYMEWLMIALVIGLCVRSNFERYTLNFICSLTILLLTVELFQLLGSLPFMSLSLRMHMFQMVLKSFLKNFLFYSIFVAAFSLCFYIMIGRSGEAGDDLNGFTNPPKAFLKSIVMMIGELDAGDLRLNDSFTTALFLGFVFVVTIVLFNLINGSAIHDILEIEKDAKINETQQRVKLLSDNYDNFSTMKIGSFKHFQSPQSDVDDVNVKKLTPKVLRRISIYANKDKKFVAEPEWCMHTNEGKTIYFRSKKESENIFLDQHTIEDIMQRVSDPHKTEDDVKQMRKELKMVREKLKEIGEALKAKA
ncbi:transient receptor potential cation channel protein painless [Stomoxys calcitrans]|uniref:transient receptor potential cation channel protein painless n=1 Tax=Stomoxys calcitrans TaxID=35570 RepID=UPI0027E25AB1|nr:transient receptor potential cation channel protein painless [Stomoxys calcitrans]